MKISERKMYSFKPFSFELVQPYPQFPVPAARSGHRIVSTSKNVYLFGGYSPLHRELKMQEMWCFNLATRKWTQVVKNGFFPDEVISTAAVCKRQQLLVYGGTGIPFGFHSSNQLHAIKLNKESSGFFPVQIAGKTPQHLYGQAIVLHKSYLYTIGGTAGWTFVCDVHRVNLRKDNKVWKKLYPLRCNDPSQQNGHYEPEGRYRHELACDGENIYILGGGTVHQSFSLIEIPAFNIRSKRWQKLKSKPDLSSDPPFPQPRKCHGAVQVKTENDIHVFLMGGYQNCNEVYNDLWRLELSTLQWTRIQNSVLPRALYFHSASVTPQGKMYIFGGITQGEDAVRVNNLHAAWVCIPKLSEICWEAVVSYCKPASLTKVILEGFKVPKCFINRVE